MSIPPFIPGEKASMERDTNIEQQIVLLSRQVELAKVRFGRWLVGLTPQC